VASDGGIFAFGDATFYGSMGNQHLNARWSACSRPGTARLLDGGRDGGVFNYGDAQFYGSAGGMHLTSAIVGMVATDDGLGYFLVAANGGVYAFGDAHFVGGTPNTSSPIVGLAPPLGCGYWLASTNGAVSNSVTPTSTVHGRPAPQPPGGRHRLDHRRRRLLAVASDGGVFAFGNAIYDGSTGNITLNSPMVSLADI